MNPNASAFPAPSHVNLEGCKTLGNITCQPGLTIRQYYAAMAMQGMLNTDSRPKTQADFNPAPLACMAFKIADAMMERS